MSQSLQVAPSTILLSRWLSLLWWTWLPSLWWTWSQRTEGRRWPPSVTTYPRSRAHRSRRAFGSFKGYYTVPAQRSRAVHHSTAQHANRCTKERRHRRYPPWPALCIDPSALRRTVTPYRHTDPVLNTTPSGTTRHDTPIGAPRSSDTANIWRPRCSCLPLLLSSKSSSKKILKKIHHLRRSPNCRPWYPSRRCVISVKR